MLTFVALSPQTWQSVSLGRLSWQIGRGQVCPITAVVDAILTYPIPTTRHELWQFLGLVGYYQLLCHHFSAVVWKDIKILYPMYHKGSGSLLIFPLCASGPVGSLWFMWMSWGKVEMVALNSRSRERLLVNVNADEAWEFAFYKHKPNMASAYYKHISMPKVLNPTLALSLLTLADGSFPLNEGLIVAMSAVSRASRTKKLFSPLHILHSSFTLSLLSLFSQSRPVHSDSRIMQTSHLFARFHLFFPSSQRSPLCVLLWEGSLLVSTRAGVG